MQRPRVAANSRQRESPRSSASGRLPGGQSDAQTKEATTAGLNLIVGMRPAPSSPAKEECSSTDPTRASYAWQRGAASNAHTTRLSRFLPEGRTPGEKLMSPAHFQRRVS
jgi:hypothetical protein